MTYEFVDIVKQAVLHQEKGLKNVLATVVHLEGSSYRKPGVRMLICEDGKMIGAVSGGCVEKEVKLRAQSVFKDGIAKVITYDGRYRLGCEGILYILIEPFHVSNDFTNALEKRLSDREEFTIHSSFVAEDEAKGDYGSTITFQNDKQYTFNGKLEFSSDLQKFSQKLKPLTKLLIVGGEHDAVKLTSVSSLLGWEVDVITSIKDPKSKTDFPGANTVTASTPEIVDLTIDSDTVVVLMTHNYVQDLKYLLKIINFNPMYIGVLGSTKRRDQLENDLFHYKEDVSEELLDKIYSPAGLHIGAITPEEIAVSIVAEILAVIRKKEPYSLRKIKGKIHLQK
ncbi:XdhC family protein [Tenacibaculum jejuense]|uniref:XdhC and CoxI family protein n=1 Tax=Tenacibaculum jejuense TaxID=584609 RepID=A0A238UCR8_9FLAO|nr:XdhC/CoxI family protein [Tenacibaculum jejuense]SNR17003.1 XdhC and CoxI family protein [Tenacibaculum jejuense]